jgi:hypothetical protein
LTSVLREDNRAMISYGEEKEYRYFCLLTPSAFYQAYLHDSNMLVKNARPASMADITLFHEILYEKQADSFEFPIVLKGTKYEIQETPPEFKEFLRDIAREVSGKTR